MAYSYKTYSDMKDVMKKFVNASEGSVIYSLGKTRFMTLAKEAGAKGVKNLTEVFTRYTDDPTKFAEMVRGVTKEVTRLGLSIIEEELESYD